MDPRFVAIPTISRLFRVRPSQKVSSMKQYQPAGLDYGAKQSKAGFFGERPIHTAAQCTFYKLQYIGWFCEHSASITSGHK